MQKEKRKISLKPKLYGKDKNSLAVQWLRWKAFTAQGLGSIPGLGTKILQTAELNQKKKKKERERERERERDGNDLI